VLKPKKFAIALCYTARLRLLASPLDKRCLELQATRVNHHYNTKMRRVV